MDPVFVLAFEENFEDIKGALLIDQFIFLSFTGLQFGCPAVVFKRNNPHFRIDLFKQVNYHHICNDSNKQNNKQLLDDVCVFVEGQKSKDRDQNTHDEELEHMCILKIYTVCPVCKYRIGTVQYK